MGGEKKRNTAKERASGRTGGARAETVGGATTPHPSSLHDSNKVRARDMIRPPLRKSLLINLSKGELSE